MGFGERIKIDGLLLWPFYLEAYFFAWHIPSHLSKFSTNILQEVISSISAGSPYCLLWHSLFIHLSLQQDREVCEVRVHTGHIVPLGGRYKEGAW